MTNLLQRISVPARPAAFEFDSNSCAVLVIDMQNEFGSKGGMFDRAGIDLTPITSAIAATAAVLKAARERKIPVIYLKMQHRADLADMGPANAPHRQKHAFFNVGQPNVSPDGQSNRVLIEGHWGTEIIESLAPEPGDLIVAKHRYSGFFETPLDGILRGLGVKQLIVTGCTTSVCVESTVRDAMFRDYHCCVLTDCTGEPIGNSNSRGNHEASLLTIELLFGWVTESRQFLAAISG